MRYFYILFFLFLVIGCSQKTPTIQKKVELQECVSDLTLIPQDVSLYSYNIHEGYLSTLQKYQQHYFKPWNIEHINISKNEAMWPYKAFKSGNSYGGNLQLLNQSFFDKILENSNFKNFATVNKRAITLCKLNIRAFPTQKVLLRDPTKAGEGFPFDYLQNSTIAANKPIFISHYSKNREWAFIQTSFAYGWVQSKDIVLMPKKYTDIWQEAQQAFFTQDNQSVFDEEGNFLYNSQIGTMLPIIDENSTAITLLSIDKYKIDQPYYRHSVLSNSIVHKGILEFNRYNINKIVNQLSKNFYGWGGMYSQRDCSSMLRDFFAPFGIWLPRNSSQQSKVGKVIFFNKMNDAEKITTIKKYAVPFETLLYKKGHIVLYVGTYDNKIVVFHNTWGIKTKVCGKEGRFIIGKPIFSTLKVGSNLKNFDANNSILHQLKSMNIITQ